MAKLEKTADQLRTERAQAYREYAAWAKQTIADSVIRNGFSELDSTLNTILHVYRQYQKDHPNL